MLKANTSELWPVIWVALALRVAAALWHYFVSPLPGGDADAVAFERAAWEYSQNLGQVLAWGRSPSYWFTIPMALIYSIAGRTPLLLQFLSVAAGTYCVYLTWKLAVELWKKRGALLAAWFAALFPLAILHSALVLREVYFSVLLLLGLIYVVRWTRSRLASHMALAMSALGGGVILHGGMIAAALSFAMLIFLYYCRQTLNSLIHFRLHLAGILVVIGGIGLVVLVLIFNPTIPKFGSPSELLELEHVIDRLSTSRGDAAYPAWLTASRGSDVFWLVPGRAVYLLFSPFPWDVRAPAHLIGLVDGILYGLLMVAILLSWRNIWDNSAARNVLFITIGLVIVFGLGTSNFGTALRHREKFAEVLIVLALPFLYRMRWHSREPHR